MNDQQAMEEAARREVLELEAKIYADPTSRQNLGNVLAPEFWEITAAGEKVTRDTMLGRIAGNPLIVDAYPVDDTRVEVYGDVAISTGRSELRGRIPLADGTERQLVRANRFVHVWVKRDGTWQTVYAHSSDSADG